MAERKSKANMYIRLPPELGEKLKVKAESERRSLNNQIIVFLEKCLEQKEIADETKT